jgi:hypothetical protein
VSARTLVLALAAILWGCGEDPPAEGSGVPLVDAPPGACVGPLADFCDGTCPTFAESLAERSCGSAPGKGAA